MDTSFRNIVTLISEDSQHHIPDIVAILETELDAAI